ncbi:MAG: histidine ammonia-lyase [Bacteroidales bacterium]|nr:histidine ammonia-lyase [Bacteroidales bacterium]
MIVHQITPAPIRYETLKAIYHNPTELKLSEESIKLICDCRAYLEEKTAKSEQPIYGITTGFGSLCNISVSTEELGVLQENLVKSHACGLGPIVDDSVVKMMLFLKIHALAKGKSAVQLSTVEKLIELFNKNLYPVVHEMGSLGASGDLAPLAHLVLPLLGLGEIRYNGEIRKTEDVFKELNIQPISLGSKEGLALLNGTQFMSANGVIALIKAKQISKIADINAALSLEAYDGRIEPFNNLLHEIRPHKGQITTAETIRDLLSGSEIISQHKNHVQDPYSFRCVPQVHGASKGVIEHVESVLLTEINSVTDNPTVFPEEDLILSGGNFHGQILALAFDYLSIGLAELGSISERRVYRLIAGQRKLPEFLVAKPGLNSGFMIPQYTAASIVSRNKQLCTPASADSISSSNEQEDHVSMGANAATKLIQICENLYLILGIEWLSASQAIEFRRPLKTSPKLEDLINKFRKEVKFIENDCIMYEQMNKASEFIKSL